MKHTTPKQFEILVEFMQAHTDLSKGLLKSASGRNTATNLWKRVTSHLNAAGPPMRDVAGWKKVWADFKVHFKAKMRRNKQNVSGTGGGPAAYVPLTKLEEDVSVLLGAEKCMAGTSSTMRFGASSHSLPLVSRESQVLQPRSPVASESPIQRTSSAESVSEASERNVTDAEEREELATCSNTTNIPRKKQSLLEYQVENQVRYQTNSVTVLVNIHREIKKSRKIQKRRLKLEREKFLHQQKIDNENLKLRLSKLQMQKEALEIELRTKELIAKATQK